MKITNAKSLIAIAVLGSAFSATYANADVVYSQQIDRVHSDGGSFSSATQQLADKFRLTSDSVINGVTFYGDNFAESFTPSHTFKIRIFGSAGLLPLGNAFYDSGAISIVAIDTGTNVGGQLIFRFSTSLNGPALLGSTDYWISFFDITPALTFNNTFRYVNGVTTNIFDSTGASRGSDGSNWGTDNSTFRSQGAFDLLGSTGGTVPEPSSIALLGLGILGLTMSRRNRKTVK